jgi:hypothetical protein
MARRDIEWHRILLSHGRFGEIGTGKRSVGRKIPEHEIDLSTFGNFSFETDAGINCSTLGKTSLHLTLRSRA